MATLSDYQAADDPGKNHLLAHWLSSDAERDALYAELAHNRAFNGVLSFPSMASPNATAYLIADPALIRQALTDPTTFSNKPYAALGSGNFVLGLDGIDHRRQREFVKRLLDSAQDAQIEAAASAAWRDASVQPLKQHEFDLVELVHDAAVRFACRLFGYHASAVGLVSVIMKGLSDRLGRQIIGRHFELPPTPDAAMNERAAEARRVWHLLIEGTATLIAAYEKNPQQARDPEEHDAPIGIALLQTLATLKGAPAGVDLHTIAIGCIAGLVGNIEAAVSIAVQDFFAKPADFVRARQAAQQPDLALLGPMIDQALCRHPPAAFLPRTTNGPLHHGTSTIPAGAEVILAMGAATGCPAAAAHTGSGDPLVYGRVAAHHSAVHHHCPGERIGQQVISQFVAGVLRIDGLAQTFDARGEVRPLNKRWGLRCLSYALSHERGRRLVQQPLTVVMRVKKPVKENGRKLERIIAVTAPLIERRLRESSHVHFAGFTLVGDRLVLCTTYDGDFDTYIEYFALRVGALFDSIFKLIVDPPRMPVSRYPKEFVAKIRAYDQRPVAGYFFSAYPGRTVSQLCPADPRQNAASSPPPTPASQARATVPAAWDGTQRLIAKDYQLNCSRHFVLTVRDSAVEARSFVAEIAGLVTEGTRADKPVCALNVGLTHAGLARLELPRPYLAAFAEHAPAFTAGAHSRAARYLADTAASAAEHWESPYHPTHAHMLLTLHAGDTATLDEQQKALEKLAHHKAWAGWQWPEDAAHLTHEKPRKVHFGYTDGWSVVHIRGIHDDGTHAPGEFLLGHPNDAGVDFWARTLEKPKMRAFFANGGFGAFRKIEQHVEAFNAYVVANARTMNVSGEYLMAKMCGRWTDGRIVCPQDGDRDPAPSPTATMVLDTASLFDQDRAGLGCPFGAHMRRMNPRGDPVVPERQRPLIRRGMPYGREFGSPDADKDARGLLGLFFCASLEDQFEHLLSSWGSRNPMGPPNLGDSSDPLIGGHHRPDEKFAIPMADGSHRWLSGFAPFVTTRGTLYLFYPTVAALRIIAAAGQPVTT